MFRLNGKVALVSGAARGIGAATAQTMADEGAEVIIGDVLDNEGDALTAIAYAPQVAKPSKRPTTSMPFTEARRARVASAR